MRAEILEVIDGHAVILTPFYKMAEADWVILRLAYAIFESGLPYPVDARNAVNYLFAKYGKEVVIDCAEELDNEVEV